MRFRIQNRSNIFLVTFSLYLMTFPLYSTKILSEVNIETFIGILRDDLKINYGKP